MAINIQGSAVNFRERVSSILYPRLLKRIRLHIKRARLWIFARVNESRVVENADAVNASAERERRPASETARPKIHPPVRRGGGSGGGGGGNPGDRISAALPRLCLDNQWTRL